MEKNNFLLIYEAFSGIGSQLRALKKLTKNKVIVKGYAEWFIPAILSYEVIHYGFLKPDNKTNKNEIIDFLKKYDFSNDSKKPVNKNYWNRQKEKYLRQIYPYLLRSIKVHNNCVNIEKLNFLPKNIDIFTYSFPCQDISQQGKQKGVKSGTQSGLLFEVKRILIKNKKINNLPKTLLLENVAALKSKKFLPVLNKWIAFLKKLGYNSEFKVLNSKNYGSPQNRKRIFVISKLSNKKIIWPEPIKHKKRLKNILDKAVSKDLWIPLKKWASNYDQILLNGNLKNDIKRVCIKRYETFNSENYFYIINGFGPTLTASGANARIKILDLKDYDQNKKFTRFRYLIPSETYKYMGFSKRDYLRIKKLNLLSDSKIIFTCGNSIPVELLFNVFKENI